MSSGCVNDFVSPFLEMFTSYYPFYSDILLFYSFLIGNLLVLSKDNVEHCIAKAHDMSLIVCGIDMFTLYPVRPMKNNHCLLS